MILRGREEEELLLDGHPARLLVPAAAHDAVVDLGGGVFVVAVSDVAVVGIGVDVRRYDLFSGPGSRVEINFRRENHPHKRPSLNQVRT